MAIDPLTAGLNIGSSILDIIKGYFPGKLPPEAEAQIEQQANATFRNFVVQYEGAAKDYKDIPLVGPIVLLFRGLIRPAVTILVAYLDYLYMVSPGSKFSASQGELLYAMTVVVFIFWFGERMVKNTGLIGAIAGMFGKK